MTSPIYDTARQMIADMAARRISARELLDAHVARNEALAAKLNCVIATDIEHARDTAQFIDDARARGAAMGVLAGLPMTIKDGFDVDGMPAMAGNPRYADRPKECTDAELVDRVRKADAIVWGKTNVPFMLGDFQSYNAVSGTTNNPYDVSRTPGGSSGVLQRPLAAGITPLGDRLRSRRLVAPSRQFLRRIFAEADLGRAAPARTHSTAARHCQQIGCST